LPVRVPTRLDDFRDLTAPAGGCPSGKNVAVAPAASLDWLKGQLGFSATIEVWIK
jgi:hypothetical protein